MNKSARLVRQSVGRALTLMLIGLGLSLQSMPALADQAARWFLVESAGQVRLVSSGISPVALTTGDVFTTGQWIETGPDGRAVLRRGSETIVVAPNSRIGLPQDNTGHYATRILQTLGTILLRVDKKATQHFEVQTPYLAAVVKGTTFTVGIEGARTAVHVVEGLVEVRDLASGLSSLVHPGQTGAVFRGSGLGVTIRGAPPASTGGPEMRRQGPAPSDGGAKPTPDEPRLHEPRPGAVVIAAPLGPGAPNLMERTDGLVRDASTSDLAVAGGGPQEPAQVPASVSGVELSSSSLRQNPPESLGATLGLGETVASPSASTSLQTQASLAPPAVAPLQLAPPAIEVFEPEPEPEPIEPEPPVK